MARGATPSTTLRFITHSLPPSQCDADAGTPFLDPDAEALRVSYNALVLALRR